MYIDVQCPSFHSCMWTGSLGVSRLSTHTTGPPLLPISTITRSRVTRPAHSCPDVSRGDIICPLKERTLFLPGLGAFVELPAFVGPFLMNCKPVEWHFIIVPRLKSSFHVQTRTIHVKVAGMIGLGTRLIVG